MGVNSWTRDNLARAWGVFPGYSLWSTPIKILFVIDGDINLSSGPTSFGLGFVLETLRAPNAWWVSFMVHVAKRDGDIPSQEIEYPNFKFTNPNFILENYDQVWFFGENPKEDVGQTPGWGFQLDAAELKLLADWMERGGGVFAAGDHSVLGEAMCSGIPRVRTMRRWTLDQNVPTRDGSTRYQTLQGGDNDERERDTLLQPVELTYFRRVVGPLPFMRPLVAHALLYSPQGPIDRFPDHMHEGAVFADEDVELDNDLNIEGYLGKEYPFEAESLNHEARRPRPRVIAFGRTTNVALPAHETLSFTHSEFERTKRFGLVGAYDGDAVGLGRVVVDSTWHHWFSYNLVGIESDDKPAYEKMQAYYRNVGIWLATPDQRRSMMSAGIWGVLTNSEPAAFPAETTPWEIGERVLITLGRTASPAMLSEFVSCFLDQKIRAVSSVRSEFHKSEPSWSGVPEDLLNRAVVGGIGSALLDYALDHRQRRGRGQRPRVDAEAIRRRVVDGVSRGWALLKKAVDDAATATEAVRKTLLETPKLPPINICVPIEVHRLRIVAETLQLPDPTDPALIGHHVTLTVRIRLDDSVVADQIFEAVDLSSFRARGDVVKLSRDVGEFEVQTGESLSIEVLVGKSTSKEYDPEVTRFSDTLRGDAVNWIGAHSPARSQIWRLWYRILEVAS